MTQDEVTYVSGSTRLFGIVGDPIEQVRSPGMITAELRRRGADAVLVPIHVRPDDFEACVRHIMKIRNLGGLVFTIPYKARACALADELGPQARAVGAANALTRRTDGGWVADIFDGLGCIEAFRRQGFAFAGRRAMLIGAGGAGSAIGVAIACERPAAIRLFDGDAERARALADKIRRVDGRIAVEIGPPAWDGFDVLLNASPVGMLDDRRLPVAAAALPRQLVVFDAVVKPEKTGLLALAEASGCRTIYGRDMMRGQIARMVDFFGYPRNRTGDTGEATS
ncbi:MAG: shikimate dehydrogenase [Proteobacteria bacterium]|nr:shikimate dehydrogenase [Pseudomonadota bacterium]